MGSLLETYSLKHSLINSVQFGKQLEQLQVLAWEGR